MPKGAFPTNASIIIARKRAPPSKRMLNCAIMGPLTEVKGYLHPSLEVNTGRVYHVFFPAKPPLQLYLMDNVGLTPLHTWAPLVLLTVTTYFSPHLRLLQASSSCSRKLPVLTTYYQESGATHQTPPKQGDHTLGHRFPTRA